MDAASPRSFRLVALAQEAYDLPFRKFDNPNDAHPSLSHLCLLVFEAVLEVVCVSLPGYIVARLGHFDADKQKFLANLNVMLFTPCLSTFLTGRMYTKRTNSFFLQFLLSWLPSSRPISFPSSPSSLPSSSSRPSCPGSSRR